MHQQTKPEADVGESIGREKPDFPRVGVGVLVLRDDQFILVKRGKAPAREKWTLPGGLVHVGETLGQAAERELMEECNVWARLRQQMQIFEYIEKQHGQVLYHYIVVDYVADYLGGELSAGSDVLDARWFRIEDIAQLDTSEGLSEFITSLLATA